MTDGQTDERTDGQTDGIAVASTALAMRRDVKIGDFRQITRYNSKTLTVASVVNLVRSVASLSHFVCSAFAVMQRVVLVRQRQLILVDS